MQLNHQGFIKYYKITIHENELVNCMLQALCDIIACLTNITSIEYSLAITIHEVYVSKGSVQESAYMQNMCCGISQESL